MDISRTGVPARRRTVSEKDEREGQVMEFKEFCKKYMRMCKSYENCEGCPRNGKGCLEFDMDLDSIGELENDVEIWAEEHPQRTRLEDFKEKYPHAMMETDGTPTICCIDLGYRKEDCDPIKESCVDCWNIPVEEDE